MGIKTAPQPPYSPDVGPCDFCLFPKLRGSRYETIEEMKEAVTKVIDTLPQEGFCRAFQKLLEQYKCIAAGGDYFKGVAQRLECSPMARETWVQSQVESYQRL